ncbi:YraN family protein [Yoonia sp. 2307UL14-13]|uniref:YraN family protein n=1 Tax=Yoonia sp. 2307UL14-13 TaxID=3126506 RepID=UPI0030B5A22D
MTFRQTAETGRQGYFGGQAAEDIVARDYTRRHYVVAAQRWRGKAGEIDLIVRDGEALIFVEVKKSRDFATASTRLSRRQMDRICAAATEFVAGEPRGLLTDMRFDLALVDAHGAVNVMENAFMEA